MCDGPPPVDFPAETLPAAAERKRDVPIEATLADRGDPIDAHAGLDPPVQLLKPLKDEPDGRQFAAIRDRATASWR